jgi:DNA (cytosine-5)-methyltransferase 1
MGYCSDWKILNASDFGVPQLRPRFILVAIKNELNNSFEWPKPFSNRTTVGEALFDLIVMKIHFTQNDTPHYGAYY